MYCRSSKDYITTNTLRLLEDNPETHALAINSTLPKEVNINVGWGSNNMDRTLSKSGPMRSAGKRKDKAKSHGGPSKKNLVEVRVGQISPRQGYWIRAPEKPLIHKPDDNPGLQGELKRKSEHSETYIAEDEGREKKLRWGEETKNLNFLMTTQIGLAEVAGQPC